MIMNFCSAAGNIESIFRFILWLVLKLFKHAKTLSRKAKFADPRYYVLLRNKVPIDREETLGTDLTVAFILIIWNFITIAGSPQFLMLRK